MNLEPNIFLSLSKSIKILQCNFGRYLVTIEIYLDLGRSADLGHLQKDFMYFLFYKIKSRF